MSGRRRRERAAEPLGGVVGVGRERDDAGADLVDPQIGDVRVVGVVEQDVLRTEAPVHDAEPVGDRDAGGHLLDQRQWPCAGSIPSVGDAVAQVAAADEPADHDRPARLSPVVEQRKDVRMVDAGDALRSALEPAHELGMADHPRPEDPHRHFSPDRRLVGAVDLAELARADQRPQLVARHRPGCHARYRRRQTIDDGAPGTATQSPDRRVGRRAHRRRDRRCRSAPATPPPSRTTPRSSAPRAPRPTAAPGRDGRRRRDAPPGRAAVRPARRRRTSRSPKSTATLEAPVDQGAGGANGMDRLGEHRVPGRTLGRQLAPSLAVGQRQPAPARGGRTRSPAPTDRTTPRHRRGRRRRTARRWTAGPVETSRLRS